MLPLFVDDLGYGDIRPFGATKQKTPHLDKFASEGRKFTSFYATPVCSMSRACLMTGCYNARVSIPGVLNPKSSIGLHTDEITLAEIMKPRGYSTICVEGFNNKAKLTMRKAYGFKEFETITTAL